MMRKTFIALALAAAGIMPTLAAPKVSNKQQTEAAKQVIGRFLNSTGAQHVKVNVKISLPKVEERDQYTVEVDKKGVLQIQASDGMAACRAFYDYVRRHNYGINSWTGNRADLPSTLAPEGQHKVVSPYKHHYYYNVVTYGYSLPYWGWNEWEKEIDWMAMHGMDMPLALVANEAISARVWKRLGLTDEEIQNYFVGPAHLPWMRMGNITGVDSPMPMSWHEDQVKLQHKILSRMRSLGMKPICPGFAGFLPKEIKRIFPEANMVQSDWDAFHNWMLMADDPLFAKIGKMFVEEWEKEFGKCDYYIADSFNEMSVPFPPKGTKERYDKLEQYGRTVYEGIRAANPDAVWVMQGWMLGFTRSIWDYDSYSALMRGVPDNKVLILDMAEDYNYKWWRNTANWEFFKGFDNKQWVYSTIPNMGGKTGLTGYLEFYANGGRLDALSSPNRGNLVGYGTAPEGIENNEVIYELICDAGWTTDSIDLKQWLNNYSISRYSKTAAPITKYWEEITQSVYNNFTDHPRYVWQFRPGRVNKGTYQIDSLFFDAIEQYAKAAQQMKDSPLYVTDLTDLAAQYAGGKMEVLMQEVLNAAMWDEVEKVDSVGAIICKIATKMDQILSVHPVYNLQRWIDMAKAHATTPEEEAYYEMNAKRIVTVWGPPVDDYSARIWSGLIRDYYLPRLNAYFSSLKTGQPFDYAKWEVNWVEKSRGLSSVERPADQVQACLDLIEMTRGISHKAQALTTEDVLATWTPDMVKAPLVGEPDATKDRYSEWHDVEWTVPVSELKGLKGFSFRWVRGIDKLEINKVVLVVDGQVVAENEHFGETGVRNIKNDYPLDLPKELGGNNGVTLRATVRSTNSCSSYGQVIMVH